MTTSEMINKVIQGDCLEVMKQIDDNSVDSIVTDPPYEIAEARIEKAKENSERTRRRIFG